MKTVIFVGGTAYSGSTFFDMTLSNDPHGFSCGEVRPLLHPYRPGHRDVECICGGGDCRIWQDARKAGEDNFYEFLFERLPDVEFLVDSSKEPFWIARQSAVLWPITVSWPGWARGPARSQRR